MGLAKVNDGALCVFAPGFANREGEPLPLIVRKQDGGFGYAATDLAALRHRTQTLRGTRLLYVVGAPQAQHFAMVFAVGELAGWLKAPVRAEHVAFGAVLGADKKMYKTAAARPCGSSTCSTRPSSARSPRSPPRTPSSTRRPAGTWPAWSASPP
jgi:arginyl-tRNA synthetase